MAKKDVGSIDDFFEDIRKRKGHKINEAFENYESVTDEHEMDKMYNSIFKPAHDAMIKGVSDKLDETFDSDSAKTHNKKKEIKTATAEGLKKYFEKVRPGVLKGIEGIEDIEEQCDILVREYDNHVGVSNQDQESLQRSLAVLVDSVIKDKKMTVGKLKRLLDSKHYHSNKGYALSVLDSQAQRHFFETYHDAEIGSHVKGILENRGIEVDDPMRYVQADRSSLIGLNKALKKGKGSVDLEQHGLKYQEDEKEKSEKKKYYTPKTKAA